MAARATTPVVEEYDFDSWTEEDETKAIAALAPDVRYIIVEKNFIGKFPSDGTTVKMPLTISLDQVDALKAGDPVDQFRELLRELGGADVAAEFSRHDLVETIAMAEKFFTVFARIAKASVPES